MIKNARDIAQGALIVVCLALIVIGIMLMLHGCAEGVIIQNDSADHPFPYTELADADTVVYMPNCVRNCIAGGETVSAEANSAPVTISGGAQSSAFEETISESLDTGDGGGEPKAGEGY